MKTSRAARGDHRRRLGLQPRELAPDRPAGVNVVMADVQQDALDRAAADVPTDPIAATPEIGAELRQALRSP